MTTLLDTPTAPPSTRTRGSIAAGALGLAALTQIVLLLVRPWGERNDFLYDSVAPIRSHLWAGLFVDGLTFAAIGITLSLVVCDLVRTRGAVWATVGAVVTTVGAIVYAMGALAMGTLAWYATSTSAIDATAGRQLMGYAIGPGSHPKASLATVPTMAGFVVVTVGSVLLFVALIRAAVVPRWLPIAFLVVTVGEFLSQGRVSDLIQVVWMVAAATLAVLAVKARQS